MQHKQGTNSQLSQVTYKPTAPTRPHELLQHLTNLPTMVNRLMTTNLNRTRARQHRTRSPSLETRLRAWSNERGTHASDKQRTCWKKRNRSLRTVGLAWKMASLGHRFGRGLVRRRRCKLLPNPPCAPISLQSWRRSSCVGSQNSREQQQEQGCTQGLPMAWPQDGFVLTEEPSPTLQLATSVSWIQWARRSSGRDHPIKEATLALDQMDLGPEGPGRCLRSPRVSVGLPTADDARVGHGVGWVNHGLGPLPYEHAEQALTTWNAMPCPSQTVASDAQVLAWAEALTLGDVDANWRSFGRPRPNYGVEPDGTFPMRYFGQLMLQEVNVSYSLMLSLIADSRLMLTGEVPLNSLRRVGVPGPHEGVRFQAVLRSWMVCAMRRTLDNLWVFLEQALGPELWGVRT